MLREIEFKGTTLTGKIVTGSLLKINEYCYIADNKGGNQLVEEDSVGQFAGKLDYMERKIFENDIVLRILSKTTYRVIFQDSEFALKNIDSDKVVALNSFESEDLQIINV